MNYRDGQQIYFKDFANQDDINLEAKHAKAYNAKFVPGPEYLLPSSISCTLAWRSPTG
jgi:hypothetical protein